MYGSLLLDDLANDCGASPKTIADYAYFLAKKYGLKIGDRTRLTNIKLSEVFSN